MLIVGADLMPHRGGVLISLSPPMEDQVGWEPPAGPSHMWVVRRSEAWRGALPT
jgi:hypothetical protein